MEVNQTRTMKKAAGLLLAFTIGTVLHLHAQKSGSTTSNTANTSPYTIKVKINGVKDTAIYLANYFGNKIFYNDTVMADANGVAIFKGKPYKEGGKYAVVAPGPRYFDILVTEEDIDIETDVNDFVGKMKINKSEENKVFYEYINFIDAKKKARDPLDARLADSTIAENEAATVRNQLRLLNDEVIKYQKDLVEKKPGMLASKLIKMTMEISLPEPPAGNTDPNWKYHYYVDHFWDNTDLTDPRIVRDQSIHRLLETFANTAVAQIPDTVFVEAKKVIEKTKDNPEVYKYFVHFFTSNAEKSKIMCMDKMFVLMVDEYYQKGKTPWMDAEQMTKILEGADKKRFSMCGEIVPNIILPDTTEKKWMSLYDIKSDYTVITIWESNCGHCKKEMPKLQELYEKYKSKGLEIYAIGNEFENDDWRKFIREKNLNWINVSDNPQINKSDSAAVLIRSGITTLQSLNFRKTFDVYSTPKIFLLDKDKKVIAKQIGADQLGDLLLKLIDGAKPEDIKEGKKDPKKEADKKDVIKAEPPKKDKNQESKKNK
jgi:thiol-disulfide isomerase/thioredoxin